MVPAIYNRKHHVAALGVSISTYNLIVSRQIILKYTVSTIAAYNEYTSSDHATALYNAKRERGSISSAFLVVDKGRHEDSEGNNEAYH